MGEGVLEKYEVEKEKRNDNHRGNELEWTIKQIEIEMDIKAVSIIGWRALRQCNSRTQKGRVSGVLS